LLTVTVSSGAVCGGGEDGTRDVRGRQGVFKWRRFKQLKLFLLYSKKLPLVALDLGQFYIHYVYIKRVFVLGIFHNNITCK
jgi:hypothetical protein